MTNSILIVSFMIYSGVTISMNKSPNLGFLVGGALWVLVGVNMIAYEFLCSLFGYCCEPFRKLRGFKMMDFADEP